MPAFVQQFNQKDGAHTRLLKTYESTGNDDEDRANLGAITDAVKSTAAKVKVNTQLKLWLATRMSGIDVLNTLKLGDDVVEVLKSSKLEILSKYVDKFNKGKVPSKHISVVGILIEKYGDNAVTKAIASAKQADDTVVVTKLETELFTRWMNKRDFPENIFSNLKIRNEEDTVLRIGKIGLVNNYIAFFNGKVDKKDNLLKVLSKGFGNEQNTFSILAAARKNPLTMKKATELETTLLLQKVGDKMTMMGGLDNLGNNLGKLDDYVKSLRMTHGNNDVSMLKTLLAKYSDVTVAKALEKAKSVEEGQGIATKLQTEQFQTWLKDGKSIDDVYKLLKLDDYGETIMFSRALDTLESYTTFFNQGRPVKESFIKIISSHFGGEDKFALKLLGFKGLESSREKAIELQNKLFQQWKSEGLDSVSVLNKVFKVRKTEKTTDKAILRTAKEFKGFLRNTGTTP
ncbi:Avirulence (Avh) protein [Phytophthora megakarya]|uniref:Avirulence (Avh) protein n=1 Tax=Phytophthora megakarya TaxID=4795 RepID=A0A225W398_9STRA|nr:Avirulence (Avh) protein [Phytophthora megakarya]